MPEFPQFPILEQIEKNDYANYRHAMFLLPIVLDANCIVETGLGNGHSTRIWLESLSQLPGHKQLHTFEIEPDKKVVDNINQLLSTPDRDIYWNLHVGKSIEEAKSMSGFWEIDLLYIDSLHTYEYALAELNAFKPYLSSKAWILLDDTYINGDITDVYRAAQDWIKENPEWKSMLFTETRGFGKENIMTNGKMILRR